MSFRTVVIKSRGKLEYSLNYLIFRGEEDQKILLTEITTLIIQSTQVAITTTLISKLIENKVKVIFCDAQSNPQGEIVPYFSNFNTHDRILNQLTIKKDIYDIVWKSIITRKIIEQAINLKFKNIVEGYEKLINYSSEITNGDLTNREGHAAKVYFNCLFGTDFSRDKDIDINKYLNYGYSVILSAINREIKSMGYLTEIGIHHIGATNPFNLSCDLIEPLRPLVDYYVISEKVNNENFKKEMINLLNLKVKINDNTMYLDNAIKIYIQSVFNALFKCNPKLISFISYERI